MLETKLASFWDLWILATHAFKFEENVVSDRQSQWNWYDHRQWQQSAANSDLWTANDKLIDDRFYVSADPEQSKSHNRYKIFAIMEMNMFC